MLPIAKPGVGWTSMWVATNGGRAMDAGRETAHEQPTEEEAGEGKIGHRPKLAAACCRGNETREGGGTDWLDPRQKRNEHSRVTRGAYRRQAAKACVHGHGRGAEQHAAHRHRKGGHAASADGGEHCQGNALQGEVQVRRQDMGYWLTRGGGPSPGQYLQD